MRSRWIVATVCCASVYVTPLSGQAVSIISGAMVAAAAAEARPALETSASAVDPELPAAREACEAPEPLPEEAGAGQVPPPQDQPPPHKVTRRMKLVVAILLIVAAVGAGVAGL